MNPLFSLFTVTCYVTRRNMFRNVTGGGYIYPLLRSCVTVVCYGYAYEYCLGGLK